MCKPKTVYRIKGLIRQSQISEVLGLIPRANHVLYTATFRDKQDERRIAHGKKPMHADFKKYGHIEVRDSDKEHLATIYQAIRPYLVRNYTHDFA